MSYPSSREICDAYNSAFMNASSIEEKNKIARLGPWKIYEMSRNDKTGSSISNKFYDNYCDCPYCSGRLPMPKRRS